jgi:hypothetical protein
MTARGGGLHRQRQLRREPAPRHRPGAVRGCQGGHQPPDPHAGGRARPLWHPREHRRPRHDADRARARGAERRLPAGPAREHPARAPHRARRPGGRRAVSRVGSRAHVTGQFLLVDGGAELSRNRPARPT